MAHRLQGKCPALDEIAQEWEAVAGEAKEVYGIMEMAWGGMTLEKFKDFLSEDDAEGDEYSMYVSIFEKAQACKLGGDYETAEVATKFLPWVMFAMVGVLGYALWKTKSE